MPCSPALYLGAPQVLGSGYNVSRTVQAFSLAQLPADLSYDTLATIQAKAKAIVPAKVDVLDRNWGQLGKNSYVLMLSLEHVQWTLFIWRHPRCNWKSLLVYTDGLWSWLKVFWDLGSHVLYSHATTPEDPVRNPLEQGPTVFGMVVESHALFTHWCFFGVCLLSLSNWICVSKICNRWITCILHETYRNILKLVYELNSFF